MSRRIKRYGGEPVVSVDFSKLANFQPKQKEALEATKKYKYVLYGGSMGSGKSYFIRWALLYWILKMTAEYKQPGIRVALFCEDYGSLQDRHISKIKFEFPRWIGEYNAQLHEFRLAYKWGSGSIAFRNLDDPSKYISSEFAVIAVDEANRNSVQIFNILRTRLRWRGIDKTKFICASNPGGEPWVRQYFVDRNFPLEEKEPDEFYFVPALPKDNKYLGESYYKNLESLTEVERKAFLEGDWTAFDDEVDYQGWLKLLTQIELQNAIIDKKCHIGDGVLGIDPAAGGDKSSVVLKTETQQEVVFCQRLADILQLIPIISGAMEKYGRVKQIIVDRTGVGEGLFRRLKELKFPVKGISFSESPSDKTRFENYKAELYWKERNWILGGGKLLKHNGWNDFINIKYQIYNDRVIRIQSKAELRRRGFRSPDAVDAAALTMAANINLRFEEIYLNSPKTDKIAKIWGDIY